MTKNESAVLERRLNEARDEATAELEAAKDALETAQLQAVAAGVPVPSKLTDDLNRCQRRLAECDGALAAFARVRDETAVEDYRRRRAEHEQQVAECLERVAVAGRELAEQIDRLMHEGAGAELERSVAALRKPLLGGGVSVLTPVGWRTSEAMRMALSFPADHLGMQVLRVVANNASRKHGVSRAIEDIEAFRAELAAHVEVLPDTWPAA